LVATTKKIYILGASCERCSRPIKHVFAPSKVSDTQWIEIAAKLNIAVAELINKEHPDFTKNYDNKAVLTDEDWIKVIQNNPEVLANSILVIEDKFYKIETPSQVRQLLSTNS